MRATLRGQLYTPFQLELFFARTKKAVSKTNETVVFAGKATKRKLSQAKKKKSLSNHRLSLRSLITLFYLVVFVGISFILFIGVLRGAPGNPTAAQIPNNLDQRTKPFELSPERGRYAIVMALDENKSFNLTEAQRDFVYPDVGYFEGRYYSFFAPGISLIAYPFYLIGKQFQLAQVATFSTITIFAFFNMLLIHKIASKVFNLPLWASLFAATTFSFGSTALSYANTLYQHQVTTFFILTAYFAVWRFSQKGKFSFIWAGIVWLTYALSIWIDYPNALLLFPVMIFLAMETVSFLRRRKRLTTTIRLSAVITVLAFVGLTAIHGYYNYVNFGSPTKVSGSIIGYKAIKDFNLLEDEKGLEKLKQFESMKTPVAFFQEENFPKGVFILLVASDKGLFFFAPIFLIALLDLFHIVPRLSRKYGILLATIGVNLFLYASFDDPWGGYAYGPRYLIPTMAILSIFAAEWLYHTKRKLIMKIFAFLLFLFSSAVAILGAITTNAVPPSVEAIPLKSAYNYVLNFSLMQNNESSSYIYNTFLSSYPLVDYFMVLFFLAILLGFSTLFLVPLLTKYDN